MINGERGDSFFTTDKMTQSEIYMTSRQLIESKHEMVTGKAKADNKVVEIKCPWNRKEVNPNVRIPDFCYFDEDGNIQLKRNHKYFWQIQTQMYTTGFKKGKFLV